jgi:ATP-dependent DNA helicase RecG
MLSKHNISDIISNGENSYVEFKLAETENIKLAREIVAFSNAKGGYLFPGIDDKGQIKGLSGSGNEERIMNICNDLIKSLIKPVYYEV